jgi:hypothetical protein
MNSKIETQPEQPTGLEPWQLALFDHEEKNHREFVAVYKAFENQQKTNWQFTFMVVLLLLTVLGLWLRIAFSKDATPAKSTPPQSTALSPASDCALARAAFYLQTCALGLSQGNQPTKIN